MWSLYIFRRVATYSGLLRWTLSALEEGTELWLVFHTQGLVQGRFHGEG